jgi:hypothetical protein
MTEYRRLQRLWGELLRLPIRVSFSAKAEDPITPAAAIYAILPNFYPEYWIARFRGR